MPLNAETDAILKDLEASGFDLSTVRKQAQVNPILENAANSKLGGALLRREEYTRYKEQKETEVQQLQKQVRDLAAAHDSAESFRGNDALYAAALEKIEIMESNMIAEGWNPEDVKSLSFNEKAGLARALTKAEEGTEAKREEGERVVPDNNNKSYLDVDTFQTAAANLIGGNVVSAVKISSALRTAERLGIEVTSELESKFEQNLLRGMEAGKDFATIADETFGFSAKIQEQQTKQRQEEIDTQVRTQLAEKLKEAGVNPASIRAGRASSIMDNYAKRIGLDNSDDPIKGAGGTVVIRGRKFPANKYGEPEVYKLRGDSNTRVQHAISEMEKLEQRQPELFEDVI